MDTKRWRGTLLAAAILVLTGPTWLSAHAAGAASTAAPPVRTQAPRQYSAREIADLVAPVALYPDDLLAIVLPASTYPLQVVQAARFLDAAKRDRTRKPDADWDASIIALLNYPEVLKRLSDQLDWTVDLGQAVLRQQPEVLAAVEGFRKRAHAAGNLRSDDRQVVTVNADTVVIRSVDPSVLYVPDYDPAIVVVERPRPVYRYYPRAYPVYYYAYPPEYVFAGGWFWGVTSYYTLGWTSQRVYVYPWDDPFHPYYGRPWLYEPRHYYYRRPPKVVHNHYYGDQSGGQAHHDGADHAPPQGGGRPRDDRRPWAGHAAAESAGEPREAVRPLPDDSVAEGSVAEDSVADDSVAVEPPAVSPPPVEPDPDRYWRPDYDLVGPRPGTEQPVDGGETVADSVPSTEAPVQVDSEAAAESVDLAPLVTAGFAQPAPADDAVSTPAASQALDTPVVSDLPDRPETSERFEIPETLEVQVTRETSVDVDSVEPALPVETRAEWRDASVSDDAQSGPQDEAPIVRDAEPAPIFDQPVRGDD
ncbi:MAG: DUF3300 domain-containing protein, partial [Gammaproteobacteria bacterium]